MKEARGGRRKSSGFSLIEMLVATVLASIVLLGLFNLVTNMVTSEVSNMRAATVGAWSLTGVNALNADISGASQLRSPASLSGVGADALVVCSNFSTNMNTAGGGSMGGPNPVTADHYCWDSTDAVPNGNTILRKTISGACAAAPLSPCTVAVYGTNSVVATGVYRDLASDPIFYADPKTPNAVLLRFSVGNPNANAVSAGSNNGTQNPVPVSIPIKTEIVLED